MHCRQLSAYKRALPVRPAESDAHTLVNCGTPGAPARVSRVCWDLWATTRQSRLDARADAAGQLVVQQRDAAYTIGSPFIASSQARCPARFFIHIRELPSPCPAAGKFCPNKRAQRYKLARHPLSLSLSATVESENRLKVPARQVITTFGSSSERLGAAPRFTVRSSWPKRQSAGYSFRSQRVDGNRPRCSTTLLREHLGQASTDLAKRPVQPSPAQTHASTNHQAINKY